MRLGLSLRLVLQSPGQPRIAGIWYGFLVLAHDAAGCDGWRRDQAGGVRSWDAATQVPRPF